MELPLLPGIEEIGKSYHVLEGGPFVCSSFIGLKLFNFGILPLDDKGEFKINNVRYQYPNNVAEVKDDPSTSFELYKSNEWQSCQKKLETKVGIKASPAFYFGMLKAQFGGMEEKAQKNSCELSYAEYQNIMYTITLERDNEKLKKYIIEDVLDDINKLPPDELFKKYGGHFLKNIAMGGKLLRSDITKNHKSTTTHGSTAEMDLDVISASLTAEQKLQDFAKNKHSEWKTNGGDYPLPPFLEENPKELKKWTESIKNKPVLISLNQNLSIPGLAFIGELADDKVRRELLDKEWIDYVKKNTKPCLDAKLVDLELKYTIEDVSIWRPLFSEGNDW